MKLIIIFFLQLFAQELPKEEMMRRLGNVLDIQEILIRNDKQVSDIDGYKNWICERGNIQELTWLEDQQKILSRIKRVDPQLDYIKKVKLRQRLENLTETNYSSQDEIIKVIKLLVELSK